MAHQSGTLAAQQVLASVSSSANQAPLDLNLSQKASQIPLKGHDETEVVHQKASNTISTSYLMTPHSMIATQDGLTANGNLDFITKHVFGHTNAEGSLPSATALETPTAESAAAEPIRNSTVIEDKVPVVNGQVLMPAGQKCKSPRVEATANAQKELHQAETTILNDLTPETNGLVPMSSERKRKSPRVQQQAPESTKKVILALEANEDEGATKSKGRPRTSLSSKDSAFFSTSRPRGKSLDRQFAGSDAPLDMEERRLLLEERKLRLAEQRFALEEKKLEATIEIGKGLIVSMERMTNTISGLGVSSTRLR